MVIDTAHIEQASVANINDPFHEYILNMLFYTIYHLGIATHVLERKCSFYLKQM